MHPFVGAVLVKTVVRNPDSWWLWELEWLKIDRRETSQSGDFFLTAVGSQIPKLAQDERAVSKESLAQGAYVSVASDCEICLFAYLYSTEA